MGNVWDEVPDAPKKKVGANPPARKAAAKAAPPIARPKPKVSAEFKEAIYNLIIASDEDGEGAPWENILSDMKKENVPEEKTEEAMNSLMDDGRVYEPVLGRLKTTDRDEPKKEQEGTPEPLQPPAPVAPPAHVPSATKTPSKRKETPSPTMDLPPEAIAKFGGVAKSEPGYTGKIRNELITVLHGNPFVSYPGLLDAAHREGLVRMTTTLLQVPNKENANTAIVSAVVVMKSKDEAGQVHERQFTGIGDANPQNVKPIVAPHLIRLAETRAKARALRDAINVGVAAVEELAE